MTNLVNRGDDPQAGLLDRLSDNEVLDLLGPLWSGMSPAEREAYAFPVAAGGRLPMWRPLPG